MPLATPLPLPVLPSLNPATDPSLVPRPQSLSGMTGGADDSFSAAGLTFYDK